MLPNERTILSMLTVALWTEQWRIVCTRHLNHYDRKYIEIVIRLGALWNWIDIVCKCPFLHQNLDLTARFASSNLNFEIKKGKFYIRQVNCCGVSVASEQQRNQDLKRICKRGSTNSPRIHHFLPECIAFNQSGLGHFLPEWIRMIIFALIYLWNDVQEIVIDFHNSCFCVKCSTWKFVNLDQ